MPFQKIGFIGLGLIGGSIAKTLKAKYPGITLIAAARHPKTLEEAHDAGVISNASPLPLTAFADCDCIFLCTPVQQNIRYLEALKDVVSPACIITDVGSVKSDIHRAVVSYGMEQCFVGGHPMCGSEKTGFANSTDHLLENAYYIITPTAKSDRAKVEAFYRLVEGLGSIPLILDYETHDYATAAISHLPHVIASSLVNLVSSLDDESGTFRTIAAGGFKDITRIASSSPVMWQHICLSNCEQITKLIDAHIASMEKIRDAIGREDKDEILSFFQSAKDYRDSITLPASGAISQSYGLYCELTDEAGAIATLATIMASHNISIKNIGILHNREYEEGVLQVEFYDPEALSKARELLSENHYIVHVR